MTPARLTQTLRLLRLAPELEKRGGVLENVGRWAKDVGGAVTRGAAKAGEELAAKGHGVTGAAVKYAPHTAAAILAYKKGYEPLKRKVQEYQYRRALKQQGYA